MCRTLITLTHVNVMEGYWGCIYTVLGRKKEQLYCCTILCKKTSFLVNLQQHIYPQIPPLWEQSWTCEGGLYVRWAKAKAQDCCQLDFYIDVY